MAYRLSNAHWMDRGDIDQDGVCAARFFVMIPAPITPNQVLNGRGFGGARTIVGKGLGRTIGPFLPQKPVAILALG